MKRLIFLPLILLQACGSVSYTGQPLPFSEKATPTVYSIVLPPAWTTTPTLVWSTGTMFVPSLVATDSVAPSATPTQDQTTPTPTLTLTPTLIPTTPVFDVGSDTFIAFVRFGWIYATNWAGKTMQVWVLESDDLVSGDGLHLEISPDRKYLAFSGIDMDARPVLEVLSLDSPRVIDREIFEGTRILDFAWSPDSRSIMASVVTVRTRHDFGTTVYRLEPADDLTRTAVLSTGSMAITQIEWPLPDRVAYLDFTCQNAVPVEVTVGVQQIFGRTGIGILNLQTKTSQQQVVSDDVEYWGSQIVLSPDGTKMVFLGIVPATATSPINLLFSTTNLSPLPCPFCRGYSDLDWAKGFLLGDFGTVGVPGGSVYLLNETGDARKLLQYENIGPNSRIYATRGITAWIDYQSTIVSEPSIIAVSDIQACLPGNAEMSSCARDMWSVEGQWPDGYNEEINALDISCRE